MVQLRLQLTQSFRSDLRLQLQSEMASQKMSHHLISHIIISIYFQFYLGDCPFLFVLSSRAEAFELAPLSGQCLDLCVGGLVLLWRMRKLLLCLIPCLCQTQGLLISWVI